jgi:two-component system competent response regulator ComA
MPGPSPAEIEKWVRTNYPKTITLVLTAHERDAYLAGMIDAGAVGFLSKNESDDRLIDAIRRAARGEFLFDSDQLAKARRWREDAGKSWDSLTDRERQILRLMTAGLNNAGIAEKLTISQKTVAYHVTNIFEKLGVRSRHEAIAWMHLNGPEDLENIPD